MKLAILVGIVCAAVGFTFGAFVYPGRYFYRTEATTTVRVDRFTGVERLSSPHGWAKQAEMSDFEAVTPYRPSGMVVK